MPAPGTRRCIATTSGALASDRADGRRETASDPRGDRRVHSGVLGDRGGEVVYGPGRDHDAKELFAVRGAPEHLRSDNGPEFVAKEIQEWLGSACVRTLYIQKASPWENGYVESFNGRLRDEIGRAHV